MPFGAALVEIGLQLVNTGREELDQITNRVSEHVAQGDRELNEATVLHLLDRVSLGNQKTAHNTLRDTAN